MGLGLLAEAELTSGSAAIDEHQETFELERAKQLSEAVSRWSNDVLLNKRMADGGRKQRPDGVVEARGACLYWALADQLVVNGLPLPGLLGVQDQKHWGEDWHLRDRAWRAVKSPILDVIEDNEHWKYLINAMLAPGGKTYSSLHEEDAWANAVVVTAAAEALGMNILCFNSNPNWNPTTLSTPITPISIERAKARPTLYIGNWDDMHFVSTAPL